MINTELARYSEALSMRPQIIVANKVDMLDRDVVDIDAFEAYVRENDYELCYVSAATGEGIDEMIRLARESDLVVLKTTKRMYEACGKLYMKGLGVSPTDAKAVN